jgi:hypothetical protein
MKKVLISLYLTEIKILKCMPFFEEINTNLLSQGVELHFLNLCGTTPQSGCNIWSFQNPPVKDRNKDVFQMDGFDRFFKIAVMRDTPRDTQDIKPIRANLQKRIQLFCTWLDYINPDFVFLWHQFRGLHFLATRILKQRDIPFGYTHLGCLPETIVLEKGGEMGESWVAREYQQFRSLPVNDDDLGKAKKYMEVVVSNKLDRKPLTNEGQIDRLVHRIRDEGRKIIFYAGQFDRYAGLIPYDENSIKFHSPIYSGTFDALAHLDEIAGRNRWAILFKPHPSEVQTLPGNLNLQSTYLIPGANIFDCIYQTDAVVTILSSISYLSRLHGRPTVMLGRHQISGKGCVCEVKKRKDTESIISMAIENGYSQDMENAWQIHIAQLLKYYLYILTPGLQEIAGRGADELAGEIIDFVY